MAKEYIVNDVPTVDGKLLSTPVTIVGGESGNGSGTSGDVYNFDGVISGSVTEHYTMLTEVLNIELDCDKIKTNFAARAKLEINDENTNAQQLYRFYIEIWLDDILLLSEASEGMTGLQESVLNINGVRNKNLKIKVIMGESYTYSSGNDGIVMGWDGTDNFSYYIEKYNLAG